MNIYLIVSETIYHTEEVLKKLKNGITNIVNFNMDENTMDEVLAEASYFSMFDDKKCIVVKKANFFGSSKNADTKKNKEACDKLLKYMENENKNTRIIFILNGKPDSKKKIYNIIKDNNNLYTFPSMTKTQMKNELATICNKNGYKIEDKSIWHIINNSLGNFDLAYNELKKIMLYYNKPTNIKYEDVYVLTSKTIEENNFKLVDSIIDRDFDKALSYLDELKILKVEPNTIIALLYREFKLMLSTIIYEENKYSYSSILSNLKLQEWQFDKVKNNLRKYNKDEIIKEIDLLGTIDYKLKSGLINKDTILISYIFNLCL